MHASDRLHFKGGKRRRNYEHKKLKQHNGRLNREWTLIRTIQTKRSIEEEEEKNKKLKWENGAGNR
jgi:hypothetical protein